MSFFFIGAVIGVAVAKSRRNSVSRCPPRAGPRSEPNLLAELPQLPRKLFDGYRGGSGPSSQCLCPLLLERQHAPHRFVDALSKFGITLRRLHQLIVCLSNVVRPMAHQTQISASAHEFDRCLSHRSRRQYCAHLEIIGNNRVAVGDTFAQDIRNPFLGDRSRSASLSDQGIRRVRNHDHRQLSSEHTIRQEIFGPKFVQRFLYCGEFVMTVQFSFSEAGKVLSASQHAPASKPREKFASISNRFTRVRRDHSRSHHAARGFKRQIEGGSEVNVEPRDRGSSLRQFAHACGKVCGRRWRRHLLLTEWSRAHRGIGPRGRLQDRRR